MNDLTVTSTTATFSTIQHLSDFGISAIMLLHKPMAKSMGKGKFRPLQLRKCSTDFDEIWTL